MAGKFPVDGLASRVTAIGICLALLAPCVSAQTGMTKAEAAQLYTAAGFPIVKDQPVNRCGSPAKPKVTLVDINGDKRPEALFVDADASCYAPSGRYFAVLVNEGGNWRPVISGTGSIEAISTRTAGWLDMRVADSGCIRNHRYDGRTYASATECSREPIGAAPRAAQSPPIQAASNAAAATQQAAAKSAPMTLQPADEAVAFKAAGFAKRGGKWRSACDDPGTPSYEPGRIESVSDVNGDGMPEAVVTEGGTYCYGNTGQGYWLVSKNGAGNWKLITNGTGMLEFLASKGKDGWPDISIGGPGFCFPVERWNGKEYKLHRWEYEGKACKPPR